MANCNNGIAQVVSDSHVFGSGLRPAAMIEFVVWPDRYVLLRGLCDCILF
jgi:hypothetical protein